MESYKEDKSFELRSFGINVFRLICSILIASGSSSDSDSEPEQKVPVKTSKKVIDSCQS